MMKTLLLLACTVFVSGFTLKGTDAMHKTVLKELVTELEAVLVNPPKETKAKEEIFLVDLGKKGSGLKCEHDYFCQAEEEMVKKVSGLSGVKFDPFRTDKKLMRNLNTYNHQDEKNCKKEIRSHAADEDLEEITLDVFLKDLLKCVKNINSQKSPRPS
ncbi:interleukin-13 precursor [Danio rerio]|uniref:Interleukin 13 n=1 Tax=Danio rerio TaxID=7955 RepID=B3IWZ9_DANRE|nr:interleukin-13 precursor [Danio rerio]BAG50536.1 interleukin 4/13A [Danio rerio]|eukprot:NP_001186834.1 interleukin 13 precursor [Danio rerio]